MKALKSKKGLSVLLTALFLLVVSFGLYGCAKKPAAPKAKEQSAPAVAAPAPAANASGKTSAKPASNKLEAAAMKIIDAQGCTGCHIINGKGGSIGPNLSKEGSKGHSIHWLEVQIKTPKVHKPTSMMPANSKMTSAELKTVAEYFESLK